MRIVEVLGQLFSQESTLRLLAWGGLLLPLFLIETRFPRRRFGPARGARWFANLGLALINSLVLRLCLPVLAFGLAAIAAQRGWGLFNVLDLPVPLAFAATLLALDLLVYLQHVVFHKVPLLWRLHRVHHSDTELDASSGVRFHFVEILLSMLLKMGAVLVLGAPAYAVLVFEIWLNANAMFNHANLDLPPRVDGVLRLLLVTPDMHRVHHSVLRHETDSNFAFSLSVWDRLFGTYRAQPEAGHLDMTIGIDAFREAREQSLHRLLAQPLRAADSHQQ